MKIKAVITSFIMSSLSLNAANLIPGDSSFETGTSWLVAGSMSGDVSWIQDKTDAAVGTSSLKVTFPAKTFSQSRLFHIKGGKYTFSFWAKTDAESLPGWIGIWKPWSQNFAQGIKITPTWTRFQSSGELKEGGAWLCIGANAPGTIWVDGFQLEHGEMTEYTPNDTVIMGISSGTEDEDRVFYNGTSVPLTIQAQGTQKAVTLKIEDAWGNEAYSTQFTPENSAVSAKLNLPLLANGIYHCWLSSEETDVKTHLSFAVVDPPLKKENIETPFLGADGAGLLRKGIDRAGIRLLEIPIRWQYIETNPGNYNWDSLKTIKALHEKGYVLKAFFSGVPKWAWNKEEKKDAQNRGLRTGHSGLFPSKKGAKAWSKFVAKVCEKYGQYITYFEIGAEDDLDWGRNPYYRNKYSAHISKSFVIGPLAERLAAFYDQGIVEIRKGAPHTKIGLLRPSGSDCTSFDYTFSEAVFSNLKQAFDYFPIDPYIVPRYLGTGMAKVQEVDEYLLDDMDRAVKMLKSLGKPTDIAISELGFAVSIKDPIDSHYYLESAKRMARSILIARAHPNVKFVQWYVIQAGTEGDKVQYNLWKSDNPTALVPAFSTVSHVVENVSAVKELTLGDATRAILFEKKDGSAAAALWVRKENGAIAFDESALNKKITTFIGNTITPEKRAGKNIYPLTDFPLYIHSSSNAELEKMISSASLLFAPLKGEIAIQKIDRAEMKITNRLNKEVVVNGKIIVNGEKKVLDTFTLAAGANRTVNTTLSGAQHVDLKLNATVGELYEPLAVKVNETFLPVKAAASTITVDGKLDDWADNSPVSQFRGRGDIAPPDPTITWSNDDDLSSDIHLSWDSKYLYLAGKIRDDKHFNNRKGGRIWSGDSIQIAIDGKGDAMNNSLPGYDDDDMELGVALTKRKGKQFYVWHGKENAWTSKTLSAVVRNEDNKTTIYELAIPWEEMGINATAGDVFAINYVIQDDDDGKGAAYRNQLTPGVCEGKDPKRFKRFFLQK